MFERTYIVCLGFGYDFHALNLEGKPNELNLAFRGLFANSTARQASLLATLAAWFPILERIVCGYLIRRDVEVRG